MPQEVLAENRFLAARDGMDAELIEPELGRRVLARELLADLVAVCRPHAQALDCEVELDAVIALGERTGAQRQIEQAGVLNSLPKLVALLAADFSTGASLRPRSLVCRAHHAPCVLDLLGHKSAGGNTN